MTDEDLIGYALDLDDPDERVAAAAYLAAHPAAAARLARVRAALAPLAADRDDPAPPPGLAVRRVRQSNGTTMRRPGRSTCLAGVRSRGRPITRRARRPQP